MSADWSAARFSELVRGELVRESVFIVLIGRGGGLEVDHRAFAFHVGHQIHDSHEGEVQGADGEREGLLGGVDGPDLGVLLGHESLKQEGSLLVELFPRLADGVAEVLGLHALPCRLKVSHRVLRGLEKASQ